MPEPAPRAERSRGTPEEAKRLIAGSSFVWHQRFELAPGVFTPGENDIEWLIEAAGVPADLSGRTAVDIGTTNGGAAFELERRGATRVVAVDITPTDHYGFAVLREFVGSDVEYVQASVYETPGVLGERFDLVLFFGVLYHLRHPLLALDALAQLLAGELFLETAVADHELGRARGMALARFYRGAELNQDSSNWFTPTVEALLQWCASSGLLPELVRAWPRRAPSRAIVRAAREEGEPEYRRVSYELPVRARVLHAPGD